jgi:nucleoside-diphosphate-sugar epimerase
MKSTVCITGSTGFVGRHLVEFLAERSEYKLLLPVRDMGFTCPSLGIYTVFPELSNITTDYFSEYNCDVVIHLAARAHIAQDASINSLQDFRKINCDLTLDLAEKAAAAGAKRFIFLSSIGVNGVSSVSPFKVSDVPAPVEHYAISKLEAEIGLFEIAARTGMDVVIIRPPLVYGPNAPGNFGKLTKAVNSGLPLPFGAINNQRSMISLCNLTDLIVRCMDDVQAGNQIFLVSDGQDVSITQLLEMMIKASGKRTTLLPIPIKLLRFLGKITGKRSAIDRLCGNLQVDIEHTKNTLGWKPLVSVQDAINKCFIKE